MSRLTAVRTHQISSMKATRARPKARPQAHAAPQATVTDLADALERAIEMSRDAAEERDVRIACAVLDPLPVETDDASLDAALQAMLGSAIAHCVWGSRIQCEPVRVRGRVALRIRFLKPGTDQAPWSADDGEICGTWVSAAVIERYGSNAATTGA